MTDLEREAYDIPELDLLLFRDYEEYVLREEDDRDEYDDELYFL